MKCGKCGNEIPSQSRFCLACGEPVSTGSSETPARPIPKRRLGLFAAIAGLCLVGAAVLLAFIVHGSKVTQATPVPNPQQTRVLNAPAPPNGPHPNVLQTDVQKPPLDLKKEEKPQPPPEVVAYLAHLKRVEDARLALQERHIRILTAMLAQAWAEPLQKMLDLTDPEARDDELTKSGANLKKEMSNLTREWQQLSAYFLSVQPPPQCQALAGKYYDALRDVISYIGKLQTYFANQDLNAMSMRGQSRPIDEKLLAADQELAKVCRENNVEKTFSIHADIAQTPVLGF